MTDGSITAETRALPRGTTLRRFLVDWLRPFAVVILALTAFRSVILDWTHVPSTSMVPTVLVGDRILVNKLAYGLRVPYTLLRLVTWAQPARGDIVVFRSPADGKRLVKRVVGLPGDRLELRDNQLSINGQPVPLRRPADAGSSGPGALGLSETERARFVVFFEQLGARRHAVLLDPLRPLGGEDSFAPLLVPEGTLFMMGDNRDRSFDSRGFGFVPRRLVLGRAAAVVLSLDAARSFRPRASRLLMALE